MNTFTPPLDQLVDLLKRLPGIGPKSAQRIAFFILKTDQQYINHLISAIEATRREVRLCRLCNNYTNQDICYICSNPKRNRSIICIVEKPFDIAAIEKSGHFKGTYHALHGVLSPIDGIGPEDLKLGNLLDRLKANEVKEVIVATNPDVEGEATAIYIARILKPLGVKVTRIAMGLPVGTDIEYADEVTISRALDGRTLL